MRRFAQLMEPRDPGRSGAIALPSCSSSAPDQRGHARRFAHRWRKPLPLGGAAAALAACKFLLCHEQRDDRCRGNPWRPVHSPASSGSDAALPQKYRWPRQRRSLSTSSPCRSAFAGTGKRRGRQRGADYCRLCPGPEGQQMVSGGKIGGDWHSVYTGSHMESGVGSSHSSAKFHRESGSSTASVRVRGAVPPGRLETRTTVWPGSTCCAGACVRMGRA